jgi:hypothetical protein
MDTAMKKYETDIDTKVIVDAVQIEYQCCGTFNYTDWFRVPKVSDKYSKTNQPIAKT